MSWETSHFFVDFAEGGHNGGVPSDLGGDTWYGISERAFSKEDFAWFWNNPTKEGAKEIYYEHFWKPNHIEKLPEHYQVVALDCVVNHRPKDAVKMFQRGLGGIKVDGIAGKKTLAKSWEAPDRVDEIIAARSHTYLQIVKRIPDQEANWNGWLRRAVRLAIYAQGIKYRIPFHPSGELSRYD